jgi:hypothetical protein
MVICAAKFVLIAVTLRKWKSCVRPKTFRVKKINMSIQCKYWRLCSLLFAWMCSVIMSCKLYLKLVVFALWQKKQPYYRFKIIPEDMVQFSVQSLFNCITQNGHAVTRNWMVDLALK